MKPADDSNASQTAVDEPSIVRKMRYAGVAYQQFLLSLATDAAMIEQGQQLFDQYYQWLELTTEKIQQEKQINIGVSKKQLKDFLEILQTFQNEFMEFYQRLFTQFKQQQSALIAENPKRAFSQWIVLFDTQYLQYMRQESVCRHYVEILKQSSELNRALLTLKCDDRKCG